MRVISTWNADLPLLFTLSPSLIVQLGSWEYKSNVMWLSYDVAGPELAHQNNLWLTIISNKWTNVCSLL